MRKSLFLPGLMFILVGLLVLLNNLGVLNVNWDLIWRFWPLILIFAGVSILLSNQRSSWIGFLVLLLLLIGVGILGQHWNWHFLEHVKAPAVSVSRNFSEDYGTNISARARFSLDASAGTFDINGTTDQLIDAQTDSNQGTFNLNRSDNDGVTTLTLKQEGNFQNFVIGKVKNAATVHLNTNPVWDIDLKTGAATLTADLSNYKVDTLTLNAGASQVTLKLGDQQQELHGTLSTGAASLKIQVPEGVGCEVATSTGLSSKDLPGFTQNGSTYRSPNFDTTSKKIYLTIKSGVSSITVSRY